jgi:hypothetical protein
VGCGSGGKKVNYAKMDVSKRIALVGVCQLTDVVVARGMNTGNADIGDGLINAIADGLDAALPSVWQGVQLTPFATVSANGALPKKDEFHRRRCARDRDPFLAKGYTGDPDKAYMGQVAKALGVDAVMAVTANLGVRYGGSTARVYNGSLNPLYVYIVDKDGEQIAQFSIKGLDSADVPMGPDGVMMPALGMSYGKIVATEFVTRMNDR